MCGVVGIVGAAPVNAQLYDALIALQHRGQDAAGMVVCDGARMRLRKGNGLVREVFEERHMRRMVGPVGIGHVRYPTAGTPSTAEAQPMYVNSPYGLALAHNGNLTNADALEADLRCAHRRHVNTDSDSEILLNVFADELARAGGQRPSPASVFAAVAGVHARCRGAYAAVALVVGGGIVGFRDCHGIRPLVFGRRRALGANEYAIASESAALDALGFEVVADVAPGEAVYAELGGALHRQRCGPRLAHAPCIFEHVYLARPDSVIDGVSVYHARARMGERLAERIAARRPALDIDVVIPVPDTARPAALRLAECLGAAFCEGLVKNPYIGRTFIMAQQAQRRSSVRRKHNVIGSEFKGRRVLLVDDSIVRGTTTRQIIQLAREAGARSVYFASAAPPVRFPNVYGIDMPSAAEFVASGRSTEEVARIIGADALIYQEIEDLVAAAREGNPQLTAFECAVFDGRYVTEGIDGAYLQRLSAHRSDAAKRRVAKDAARDAGEAQGLAKQAAAIELESDV